MTYEQMQIEKLYKLLDKLTKQHKEEEAKVLYWAIFELEQLYNKRDKYLIVKEDLTTKTKEVIDTYSDLESAIERIERENAKEENINNCIYHDIEKAE